MLWLWGEESTAIKRCFAMKRQKAYQSKRLVDEFLHQMHVTPTSPTNCQLLANAQEFELGLQCVPALSRLGRDGGRGSEGEPCRVNRRWRCWGGSSSLGGGVWGTQNQMTNTFVGVRCFIALDYTWCWIVKDPPPQFRSVGASGRLGSSFWCSGYRQSLPGYRQPRRQWPAEMGQRRTPKEGLHTPHDPARWNRAISSLLCINLFDEKKKEEENAIKMTKGFKP